MDYLSIYSRLYARIENLVDTSTLGKYIMTTFVAEDTRKPKKKDRSGTKKYYVVSCDSDRRGRRVLFQHNSGVENIIYPDEWPLDEGELKMWDLTPATITRITRFFSVS